jgi:hypothetical protein
MNMNKFKSGFLKATDLHEGIRYERIISEVVDTEFDDESVKAVVHFEGGEQPIVVNQTRLAVLIDAFGAFSKCWAGQVIHLQRGQTQYSGKTVPCIEIVPPDKARQMPVQKSAPTQIEPPRKKGKVKIETDHSPGDDDIPF